MVISGPEATAGSTPIFLKNIGTSVPTPLEISIASMRAEPIQADTANENHTGYPLNSMIYSPTNSTESTPRISPHESPTRISLATSLSFLPAVRSLSISTRIVTASD